MSTGMFGYPGVNWSAVPWGAIDNTTKSVGANTIGANLALGTNFKDANGVWQNLPQLYDPVTGEPIAPKTFISDSLPGGFVVANPGTPEFEAAHNKMTTNTNQAALQIAALVGGSAFAGSQLPSFSSGATGYGTGTAVGTDAAYGAVNGGQAAVPWASGFGSSAAPFTSAGTLPAISSAVAGAAPIAGGAAGIPWAGGFGSAVPFGGVAAPFTAAGTPSGIASAINGAGTTGGAAGVPLASGFTGPGLAATTPKWLEVLKGVGSNVLKNLTPNIPGASAEQQKYANNQQLMAMSAALLNNSRVPRGTNPLGAFGNAILAGQNQSQQQLENTLKAKQIDAQSQHYRNEANAPVPGANSEYVNAGFNANGIPVMVSKAGRPALNGITGQRLGADEATVDYQIVTGPGGEILGVNKRGLGASPTPQGQSIPSQAGPQNVPPQGFQPPQQGQIPQQQVPSPVGQPVIPSPTDFTQPSRFSGAVTPIINRSDAQTGAQGLANATNTGRLAAETDPTNVRGQSNLKIAEALGAAGSAEFAKQYDEARTSSKGLRVINDAGNLVEKGIRTGTLAGTRQAIGRAFDTFLGRPTDDKDLTSNTDTYVANAGRLVASIIKDFGSGTAISDQDRKYAVGIAGGDIAMTEDALKNLLFMAKKAAAQDISNINMTRDGLVKEHGDTGWANVFKPLPTPGVSSVKSDEDYAKIQSGGGINSIFIDPNGNVRVKP